VAARGDRGRGVSHPPSPATGRAFFAETLHRSVSLRSSPPWDICANENGAGSPATGRAPRKLAGSDPCHCPVALGTTPRAIACSLLRGPGRDLRGSWAGTVPNPSVLSRASLPGRFLPLVIRIIAAGAAWRVRRRGGGNDSVNAKLTRAANPLIRNAPDHVPQRAAFPSPRPDPPGPGHRACRKAAAKGNGPPQTAPHKGHPVTFGRLP
jgi:hypothetical protein